jgi:dTDP-4-dehydrorhamnose reductase
METEVEDQKSNKGCLALIGAGGMLAHMVRQVTPDFFRIVPFDLPGFDLTDRDEVLRTLGMVKPGIILNCAAYTNVDGCEENEELAFQVNGKGPAYLAEAARENDSTLVHISTDYVFDGTKKENYVEEDPPNPISVYGRSKLAGEMAISESGLKEFFIVRTSWLYGPRGKNFVEAIIHLAREQEEVRVVSDQFGSPTYTLDLAKAIFALLGHELCHRSPFQRQIHYGIYNFANEGSCSWHEFAEEIVAQIKTRGEEVRVNRVVPIRTEDYPFRARRPANSVFSKEKYCLATGLDIPHWRTSLKRYLSERSEGE